MDEKLKTFCAEVPNGEFIPMGIELLENIPCCRPIPKPPPIPIIGWNPPGGFIIPGIFGFDPAAPGGFPCRPEFIQETGVEGMFVGVPELPVFAPSLPVLAVALHLPFPLLYFFLGFDSDPTSEDAPASAS